MTLEELFKDKPELLNEPVVQKLVDYVKGRHFFMADLVKASEDKYNKVIDLCMYSEVMLINGTPSKEVITNILNEYGEN